MLFRNLMAMDTEEMIRAHPLDGVVLLGNCDKTTPAQLMSAASADVPAIMLTGGPHLSGRFRGESLGACSDCRRFWAEYRAGAMDEDAVRELEEGINRSDGHCTVMGTASTMAAVAEALGMSLMGSAAIPAPDARRLRMAEAVGRQIVETVQQGIRPSDLLTPRAFENAIRVMMALGGSTNAVIHLTAIAGRRGIELPLDVFDRISRETPFLTNLRPSGTFHMEQLYEAGGVHAVMKGACPRRTAPPRREDCHRPHHRRAPGGRASCRKGRREWRRLVWSAADRPSIGRAARPAGRHRDSARQSRT
jgi:dihydroxyacid dehydratase/phosphogluconate dehydratase